MPDDREEIAENSRLVTPAHGRGKLRRGGPGRPPGSVSLVAALKRKLAENPELADELMQSLVDQASGGDTQAMKVLLDRVDGPVPTRIGGDPESGPVKIELVYPDEDRNPETP